MFCGLQILSVTDMSSLWSSTSAGNDSDVLLSQVLYVEKAFNPEAAKQWANSIKSLSIWLSAIYVILVFGGQRWMLSRSRFTLQVPLFIWNAVLSLFSIMGAFRTVPHLYNRLVDYGWTYSVCEPSFYVGSTGFWAFVFTMSKAYELGDTLFLVLRRQPVIFLHWYHHITVLMYSFYSYAEHVAAARWYMVMNYCIHSLMYTYFALCALRLRMPSFVRMSVTSLQILQMILGLVVSVSVILTKRHGDDCHQSYSNAGAAILMFGSYLVLFAHFFYQQYVAQGRKKSSKLSDDKMSDLSAAEQVKKLH